MLSKNILKGTVGVILRDPSFKVSLPIHNGTLQIYVCLKINEISLFFSSEELLFSNVVTQQKLLADLYCRDNGGNCQN